MADMETVLPSTDAGDEMNGGDGENFYDGGAGNDSINGADGVNTINYELGDGVDRISFALPRSYQYADFLTEAQSALTELASLDPAAEYTNSFFATADLGLINSLPAEIASILGAMQQHFEPGIGMVPSPVEVQAAQAALSQMVAWASQPNSNVIDLGPGITLDNITVQVGRTTNYGGQDVPLEFAVALNSEEGLVFNLGGSEAVAGDTSVPPVIDMQFRFADGTTMTLAELLARPGQISIGQQSGSEDGDFLHGTLGNDSLFGNGGHDQIDGAAGDDQLYGGSGNDLLAGGSGFNVVYGEDGDDVIAGGRAVAMVGGGLGNDVYAFNRGDGFQWIENEDDGSGTDAISFGKDIAPADVSMSLDPTTGTVSLRIAGGDDQINIDWFDPYNENGLTVRPEQIIDRVQFFDADGNAHVYDLASLVDAAFPDPASADPEANVALIGESTSELDEPAAGGEAARRYAMTGILLETSNQAPVGTHVDDQTAVEDTAFSWALPAGTFVDPEQAPMALKATTPDGQALPSWLHFDADTGTFSGNPSNGDVGELTVKVTATDPAGAATSQTFKLNVQNTNDDPTLAQPVADQPATEDTPFSFVIPAETFADVDLGDSMTLSATMGDGSDLPAWLNFDPATGTFSGTPQNDDVGTISVRVTATDGAGATASDAFDLTVANTNDAPTVADALTDQDAAEDAEFAFVVPAGTFADVDLGDSMSLSASMSDGSALPEWLSFDAATGTFSGTPANADVGTINVRVTARDAAAASASNDFALNVANTNDAPTVVGTMGEQDATEDAAFTFVVPAGTFADEDLGDSMTLSASMSDGNDLPSWLHFDADTRTFSGTPGNGDVGTISVRVFATDAAGVGVSDVFDLNVTNTNDAPTVANEIADQDATEDAMFTFSLPANVFADVDLGDSKTLSATLANGAALPTWLTFDAASGTFWGRPANGDVGQLNVRVTARDAAGATAWDDFNLTVANINDAPTVANAISDQTATAGSPFSMVVPGNAFQDVDAGDALTLSARLANGDPLPGWLNFNAATRTFSGTAGAAGQWNVEVVATDMSGASVSDVFALNMSAPPSTPDPTTPEPVPGKTITGGSGNDKLTGTAGNDQITGGKGKDQLIGGAGDDSLFFSEDGKWGSGSTRSNAFTGEKVSISGKRQSQDIFDGGTGLDILIGTSGADAILLDDRKSSAAKSGARIVGVEKIDAGAGDDVVDMTSKRYTYGDIEIDGGSGNDVLWSGAGKDVLHGGSGNDTLDGGAASDYLDGGSGDDKLNGGSGIDLLQGGSGNDTLKDTSGNGLFDGGSGDDSITEGSANSMVIGGKGNDKITLGGGYDVIAFNRGDGKDVVSNGGKGGTATLSLGGGINYKDLTLSRSGNDLILNIGSSDRITFEKWYSDRKYQAVSKLQVVAEAMPGFDQGGDSLHNDKLETFDFKGLVKAFDSARGKHPGLSKWTLTNALAQFHLGGSDTAALGGDLAYQYGMNGTLACIAVNAAHDTAQSSQFGKQAQTLHSQAQLKDGLVKLS
jgi:Ca2+-binding RTX toxin-like protein